MNAIPQIVVVVIMVSWCAGLTFFFAKIYSQLQKITKGSKQETIVDILNEVIEKEDKLEKKWLETGKKVEDLIFDSQFYIQKIGLVRFNPFNDTGGDQSFILALIDSEESGVVVSGLHTRNGTRWYAKKVVHGKGVEYELSNDEVKAIKSATKRVKKDERRK